MRFSPGDKVRCKGSPVVGTVLDWSVSSRNLVWVDMEGRGPMPLLKSALEWIHPLEFLAET